MGTHIYLGDTKLATIKNNDNPYYILSDHLSSADILTSNTGSIDQMRDYTPFGTQAYVNTPGTNRNDKYRFTGKEYDSVESGLQYFGARYLNNNTARFVSVDPALINTPERFLVDPQQLNTYAYARNNPLILIDPDGNSAQTFFKGLAVGVATAIVVTAVIATAPITIPAAVITGAAVVGTGAVMYGTYSNYSAYESGAITKDQFHYNAGALLGGMVAPTIGARGAGQAGKAARNFSSEVSAAETASTKLIPDDALVVRGGGSANQTASNIAKRIGPSRTPGVSGFSVQCSSSCTEMSQLGELSSFLKNSEVSVVRAKDIRNFGGDVISTPGMGYHSTVTGLDADAASQLPWQIFKNPNPLK